MSVAPAEDAAQRAAGMTDAAFVAAPTSVDPRRTLGAVPQALTREISLVERPAIRIGAAIVAGVAIILALLAPVVPALAFLARLPWWLPPAFIVSAAALLVAVLPVLLLTRRVTDALAMVYAMADEAAERWRAETGAAYQRTPDGLERWLASQTETPGTRLPRAEVLLLLDRYADVRLPLVDDGATPGERFRATQVAWTVAFALRADGAAARHLSELRRLADAYSAPREVASARAVLALTQARMALAADGDWLTPLADARPRTQPWSRRPLLRNFVLPRLAYYGRISVGIFAALVILQLVLGSLGFG